MAGEATPEYKPSNLRFLGVVAVCNPLKFGERPPVFWNLRLLGVVAVCDPLKFGGAERPRRAHADEGRAEIDRPI